MKRIAYGAMALVFAAATAGTGVAKASAASVVPPDARSALTNSSPLAPDTCRTVNGQAQGHHMDGSVDPGRVIHFKQTICSSGSNAQGAASYRTGTPVGGKYAGLLPSRCALRTLRGVQPASYYATARQSKNCNAGQAMGAHTTSYSYNGGDGWVRFYYYEVPLNAYGYADAAFSCGNVCYTYQYGNGDTALAYTGAQMWWSVNDGSKVDYVFCS